jgi:hypothetical protein
MLVSYALRYGCLNSEVIVEPVQPPCSPLNAPTSTSPAGKKRKRTA